MAEEQRCQEGHRLCANNCGFFGSPATLNLCSKCYRDYRLKEDQANSAKIAVEKSLHASSSSSSSSPSLSSIAQSPESSDGEVNEGVVSPLVLTPQPLPEVSKEAVEVLSELAPAQTQTATAATTTAATVPANRCASCRKRVGLTGFRCRCGSTYCGAHRYAEQHACTFDFKSAGRDAIARANPLVKADKLGNKI